MTVDHITAEDIAAFLDGACNDDEHLRTQQHLDTCGACRKIAEDQQFVKVLLRSLLEPELPRSFTLTNAMIEREESAPTAGGLLLRFEPILRLVSIAAVLVFLFLGSLQLAGIGGSTTQSETNVSQAALQDQEPVLARGELRSQGESAANGIQSLRAVTAQIDTEDRAIDNRLTSLEITTIGVGAVALFATAGWVLVRYSGHINRFS